MLSDMERQDLGIQRVVQKAGPSEPSTAAILNLMCTSLRAPSMLLLPPNIWGEDVHRDIRAYIFLGLDG